MFQKSKAGVMVKTEHDKTHGTDRRRKQTNITSETMMKRRKNRRAETDSTRINQSIGEVTEKERKREKIFVSTDL